MKWIIRIITGLVLAVLVMVLIVVGVVAWDVNMGVSAPDVTNTTFLADDGTTLDAYIAMPEGEGPFPAVIMVHEWWGINQEIIELADEMAEEGYVVFAPDVYRGPVAGTIPGALYLRLSVDMERVDTDMLTAYDYVVNLPEVAGNIGVIGFCFGGDVAFNHGVANPDIDAVINLYGSTSTGDFGALLDVEAPPVLGIFAEEDQGISVDSVNDHSNALNNAGVENTITLYPEVGHAFVQPDALDEAGAPQDAWNQVLDFLDTHLRGNPTS